VLMVLAHMALTQPQYKSLSAKAVKVSRIPLCGLCGPWQHMHLQRARQPLCPDSCAGSFRPAVEPAAREVLCTIRACSIPVGSAALPHAHAHAFDVHLHTLASHGYSLYS
jgi:hypothetical protein